MNLRIQSRWRLATRWFSIKQIEITRVRFENHLPWQMDTILIQKGTPLTATVATDMTRERRV